MSEQQRVSLNQQIAELEYQLRQANAEAAKLTRGGKMTAADARMHALRLEDALRTLRLIARFEAPVKALLQDLLSREKSGRAA